MKIQHFIVTFFMLIVLFGGCKETLTNNDDLYLLRVNTVDVPCRFAPWTGVSDFALFDNSVSISFDTVENIYRSLFPLFSPESLPLSHGKVNVSIPKGDYILLIRYPIATVTHSDQTIDTMYYYHKYNINIPSTSIVNDTIWGFEWNPNNINK